MESTSDRTPRRLQYPTEQPAIAWLPLQVDAYQVADIGVAEGMRREENHGRYLACARGCSACCRSHTTTQV